MAARDGPRSWAGLPAASRVPGRPELGGKTWAGWLTGSSGVAVGCCWAAAPWGEACGVGRLTMTLAHCWPSPEVSVSGCDAEVGCGVGSGVGSGDGCGVGCGVGLAACAATGCGVGYGSGRGPLVGRLLGRGRWLRRGRRRRRRGRRRCRCWYRRGRRVRRRRGLRRRSRLRVRIRVRAPGVRRFRCRVPASGLDPGRDRDPGPARA